MEFLKHGRFGDPINRTKMHRELIKLTLALYKNLPARNNVQEVLELFQSFVSSFFVPFLIQEMSVNVVDRNSFLKAKRILDENKFPFRNFLSEYDRFNIYRHESVFIDPIEFEIKNKDLVLFDSTPMLKTPNTSFGSYISVYHSLKFLFEIPGVYSETVKHVANLLKEKTIISNFIQGKLWRNKYANYLQRFIYPIFLFFDDFEPGNGLGSHAGSQKLGGVYLMIPCLPPHIVAKLNNIILAIVFYSHDREEYGNYAVFHKVIAELNLLLKNGIRVEINNKEFTMYFQLTLVLGDNLGLNSICGFSESFSAKFYCRLCTAPSCQCKKLNTELDFLVRNKENYQADLNLAFPDSTAIKEECIFNYVDDFNIAENQSVDIMHDILEGVAKYTLGNVLHSLIYEEKLFTLETLNKRIQEFDYGDVEVGNRPQKITVDTCKDSKNKGKKTKIRIKQSAAEATCLTRYLSLIIGDLVPPKNKYYKLYLVLRKILDIVTSSRVTESDAYTLRDLVAKHNEMYQVFYGDLKPKMHFMTHFWRLLLQNGPLIHFWSMPFERKNKQIKDMVVSTECKKNYPLTIGISNQLQMCYLKEFCTNVQRDYKIGTISNKEDKCHIENLAGTDYTCLKYIEILGKTFKKNTVFLVDICGVEYPQFGIVEKIYMFQNDLYIYTKYLRTVSFNKHYHAFEVSHDLCKYVSLNIKEIPRISPFLLVKKMNKLYVATRHIL